eukprot:CAMPEP_0196656726 /NCGR_PEP_ID=MMETSP1086-20130531/19402_1 /TAXON_ID=77921 /ORGANISM="Cyanoptyche  gloeocystis , Strain SAG4.97" /LENGTH=432 /DNA_ID=CAMNT_0041989579 /DNA_START=51 /DNA_END=1349 /DNA_ORIENTATION=-
MARLLKIFYCALFFFSVTCVFSEVIFKEEFADGDWEKRWVVSEWKQKEGTAGKWSVSAGNFYGDSKRDKGLKTSEDARFYAITAEFPNGPWSNDGKDLIVQFSVKHEQKIDCGGGYLKLLPDGIDQKTFSGDTDYSIMFGPDICGYSTKKTHVIINYKGKNQMTKKDIKCETDQLTHLYTLIVKPDNTYEVQIDQKKIESGSLYDDFPLLPPKEISDPNDKKPADWVDEAEIPDPEDAKPAGWDDEPAQITDPDAKKPDDWDEENDGEWEAPLIDNPSYKGEWKPKMIKNPAYKGEWKAKIIPNPEYVDDPAVYKFPPLRYIGIEVWQVKAGTIFDNFLVTDDIQEAQEFAKKTWAKSKDKEKKMFDEMEEAKKKKEEEGRNKGEDKPDAADEDGAEDDDETATSEDDYVKKAARKMVKSHDFSEDAEKDEL